MTFLINLLAYVVLVLLRALVAWLVQDSAGLPIDFGYFEWLFIIIGLDALLHLPRLDND